MWMTQQENLGLMEILGHNCVILFTYAKWTVLKKQFSSHDNHSKHFAQHYFHQIQAHTAHLFTAVPLCCISQSYSHTAFSWGKELQCHIVKPLTFRAVASSMFTFTSSMSLGPGWPQNGSALQTSGPEWFFHRTMCHN